MTGSGAITGVTPASPHPSPGPACCLLRASHDEELEGPRIPPELPVNGQWGRLAGPSPASFPGTSQVHSS